MASSSASRLCSSFTYKSAQFCGRRAAKCLLIVTYLVVTLSGLVLAAEDNESIVMICADIKCKDPMSKGKTLAFYPARDSRMLSFTEGLDVTVFAKPADKRTTLAYAEINGKKGYVPLNLIREEKILVKMVHTVVLPKRRTEAKASPERVVESVEPQVEPKVVAENNVDVSSSTGPPTLYATESAGNEREGVDNSYQTQPEATTDDPSQVKPSNLSGGDNISEQNGHSKDQPQKGSVEEEIEAEMSLRDEEAVGQKETSQTDQNVVEEGHTTDLSKNTLEQMANNESVVKLTETHYENSVVKDISAPTVTPTLESIERKGEEDAKNVYQTQPEEKTADHSQDESLTLTVVELGDNISEGKVLSEELLQKRSEEEANTERTFNSTDMPLKGGESTGGTETPQIDGEKVVTENKVEEGHTTVSKNMSEPMANNEPVKSTESHYAEKKVEDISAPTAAPTLDAESSGNEREGVDIPYQTQPEAKTVDPSQVEPTNLTSGDNISEEKAHSENLPQNRSEEEAKAERGFISTEIHLKSDETLNVVETPQIDDENVVADDRVEEGHTTDFSNMSETMANNEPVKSTESHYVESKVEDISAPIAAPKLEANENNREYEGLTKGTQSETVFVDPLDSLTPEAEIRSFILPNNYIEVLKIYLSCISDMFPENVKSTLFEMRISSHLVVLTFIVGVFWVLMAFIRFFFSNISNESILRAQVCDFQAILFKLKTERMCLKRELSHEREKFLEIQENAHETGQKMVFLEKSLEKIKIEREELRERAQTLEKEVESATDAGLELNKILSDFLNSQKENVNLTSNLDSLQQQVTKQEEIIIELQQGSRLKEEKNAELKLKFDKVASEADRLKRVLKETETTLQTVQANNESLKSSKAEISSELNELETIRQDLSLQVNDFVQKISELQTDNEAFRETVDTLQADVEAKESEIDSLQELMKRLEVTGVGDGSESVLQELMDVAKVRSELSCAQKEHKELEGKFEEVCREKETLDRELKGLEQFRIDCEGAVKKAEKEKIDALKNLEVLDKYFKEKEIAMQRELGTQQVQRLQKEEDANSLGNRLMRMEEENEGYKSQLESMRKELAESERSWKAQLAAMEKRAHDNWVASRSADRELSELKRDSAFLRQQLTMMSKSQIDNDSNLDARSVSSLSDFSFIPPPPPPPELGLGPMPPMPHFVSMEGIDSNSSGPNSGQWDAPPPPMMPPLYPHPEFDPRTSNFDGVGPLPPPLPPMFPGPSHHQSFSHIPTHQNWDSSRDNFSPISHQSQSSRGPSPPSTGMRGPFVPMNPMGQQQHLQQPPYSGNGPFSNPVPAHWTRPNGNVANAPNNYPTESNRSSRSDSRNSVSTSRLHQSGV